MYMAYIGGWHAVVAFSDNEDEAKQLALRRKMKLYPDPWLKTWDEASDYYGAWIQKVQNGTIIDGDI